MHTVRYFDGKTYKWVGLSQQPNIIGKVCLSVISYFIMLECLIPIEIEITKLIVFFFACWSNSQLPMLWQMFLLKLSFF